MLQAGETKRGLRMIPGSTSDLRYPTDGWVQVALGSCRKLPSKGRASPNTPFSRCFLWKGNKGEEGWWPSQRSRSTLQPLSDEPGLAERVLKAPSELDTKKALSFLLSLSLGSLLHLRPQ